MTTIREHIGKRVLRSKKKGFNRATRVFNFETAESAVLLFDTEETDAFNVIRDFRKFIEQKGISCTTFGYVPQKEIPEQMLFRKHYFFITRNDLNWYHKPTGEAVEEFYGKDPDILFDFTRDPPLELQFLVQLSGAKFKIGTYTESENDYDLMINLSQPSDIGFLAEQIKRYVSMLNPSN